MKRRSVMAAVAALVFNVGASAQAQQASKPVQRHGWARPPVSQAMAHEWAELNHLAMLGGAQ